MRSQEEVKEKIKQLVSAGAPEQDIDEFVRLEGYTAEQLRGQPEVAQKKGGLSISELANRPMPSNANRLFDNVTATDETNPVRSGLWKGVAIAGGLFGNTANNLDNLVRAGAGTVAGMAGRPDLMPDAVPPENAPLTYENTINRLRQLGLVRDFKGTAGERVTERTMQDVGAGAAFGPMGAGYGLASGLGASIANEISPDNPYAEAAGSILGALTPAGAKYAASKLSPTRAVAASSEIKDLANTPYGRRGADIENQNQVNLKLSAKYGSEKAAAMEGEAAAMNPLKASADEMGRKQAFNKRISGIIERINPTGVTGSEAAKRAYSAYQAENKSVVKARSDNWKKSMAQAEALTGGKPVVSVNPALDKIKSEIDDILSMSTRGQTDEEALQVLKAEYDKLISSKGKLSIKEVQSNMAPHTSEASGTGKFYKDLSDAAERRIHGVLKSAYDEAIDAFASNPSKDYAKAGQLLKQTRQDYALQSKYLDELGKRVLGAKTIGQDVAPTSDEVLKRIRSASADERRYLMPIVEKHDPVAAQGIKADYITSRLVKSKPKETKVGPSGGVDFAKLAENWKIDRDFFATFTDRAERRDLIRARQALRRLAEEAPPKHGQSTVSSMTEVAGTFGSMHPVFVLRAIARRATPKMMAEILLTKDGREAVEIAAGTRKASTAQIKSATEKLNEFLNKNPGAVAGQVIGEDE